LDDARVVDDEHEVLGESPHFLECGEPLRVQYGP
jgi:hypothetical protein